MMPKTQAVFLVTRKDSGVNRFSGPGRRSRVINDHGNEGVATKPMRIARGE